MGKMGNSLRAQLRARQDQLEELRRNLAVERRRANDAEDAALEVHKAMDATILALLRQLAGEEEIRIPMPRVKDLEDWTIAARKEGDEMALQAQRKAGG